MMVCVSTLTTAAVVGLETTFYQVSEDVGVVEVCAVVRNPTILCPIAFPFNVNFSTVDKTAGNYLLLWNNLYLICIHVQQWP